MDDADIRKLRDGANLSGVRDHNERLVMTMIQRHGEMPGAVIAKATGLSAQTVSNILRRLESDGFLLRRTPQRGRVGKPSVPMALNPDGALSFGLNIGRRSADLIAMNLHGQVLGQLKTTYRYPMPEDVFGYLAQGMDKLADQLSAAQRRRICGIGIAAPTDIWSWTEVLGAPPDFNIWREIDFVSEVSRFSDLPLFTENDATAACRAEHVFGCGRELSDYAYFFIGSFVGGGVVLDSSVVVGAKRNAGAFGSLRVTLPDGEERTLIDAASLYLLEAEISRAGLNPAAMWHLPQDWSGFEPMLENWIETTAFALAHATRSASAVLDFDAVLVDGAFPADVRDRLVSRMAEMLNRMDTRGIVLPRPRSGSVGANARAIGAASGPIYAQYFLQ